MHTLILWLKIAHFAALLVWSAGLFTLPVLLSAYPREHHPIAVELLRARTRFGYVAIISPAAVLAIVTGTALIYVTGEHGGWLVLKLFAVVLMVLFHIGCGGLVSKLHDAPASWRPATLRSLVAAPAVLIPVVLWLVLAKPL